MLPVTLNKWEEEHWKMLEQAGVTAEDVFELPHLK